MADEHPNPLGHPDSLHLRAAQGWLELGNHLEANEELERITPQLRSHPDVLEVRWHICAQAKKWDACVDMDPGPAKDFWKAMIRTKGLSHLSVVQNTVAPGGSFGWHSHPGPTLVIVVAGTATEYHGDDPTCTPIVHPAGSTFVDGGEDAGHLVRNDGNVNLVVVAVRLFPEGALPRIDLPNPGYCPALN